MEKHRGFTLIELMIAVAVIGILTAIAYPSYRAYIIKANRAAAQSFMLEVASRQERVMLDARAYVDAPDAASLLANLGMTVPSNVSPNYTITTATVAGPPPSYIVTAVPIGKQLTDDTECGTLTLDGAMNKTEGGSGTVATCWKQ